MQLRVRSYFFLTVLAGGQLISSFHDLLFHLECISIVHFFFFFFFFLTACQSVICSGITCHHPAALSTASLWARAHHSFHFLPFLPHFLSLASSYFVFFLLISSYLFITTLTNLFCLFIQLLRIANLPNFVSLSLPVQNDLAFKLWSAAPKTFPPSAVSADWSAASVSFLSVTRPTNGESGAALFFRSPLTWRWSPPPPLSSSLETSRSQTTWAALSWLDQVKDKRRRITSEPSFHALPDSVRHLEMLLVLVTCLIFDLFALSNLIPEEQLIRTAFDPEKKQERVGSAPYMKNWSRSSKIEKKKPFVTSSTGLNDLQMFWFGRPKI